MTAVPCRVCSKKAATFDPTAPVRRSPHFADQTPRAPLVRNAERICPQCRAPLCNDHSKRCSTMQNLKHNIGRRVCGHCHTHMPDTLFSPLPA